jgi:hypothetical protein
MAPNFAPVPDLPDWLLLVDPIDRGRRRVPGRVLVPLELRNPYSDSWAGVWALHGNSGKYSKALKLFGEPMIGGRFAKLMHLIRLDIAHYGDHTQGCCIAAAPQQLVYDLSDNVVGYSMPYVDGFAWAREEEKGPPPGTSLDWARRAEALLGLWCALRDRSILHGDLQPSNMRLDPCGKHGVALIDFDEAWCSAHRSGLDEDIEVIAALQNSCPNAPKGETMCPPLVHAAHAEAETWEAAGMLVAVCQLLMSCPVKKLAFAQDRGQIGKREAGLARIAEKLCSPLVRDFVRTTLGHLNAGELPWDLDNCIARARNAIDAVLRSHQQQVTLLGTQLIRPRPLAKRQITLPNGWEKDRNVGASFIREISATPLPVSIRPPAEEEARRLVVEKLRSIQRLPPGHDSLTTSILLSIESTYSELFEAATDEDREMCIRDSFPNQQQLKKALLALIELLDPTIDVSDPVIKNADADALIKVVLFEERHRYEQLHPSTRPAASLVPAIPRPAIPPRPAPAPFAANPPSAQGPKAPRVPSPPLPNLPARATLPGVAPHDPPVLSGVSLPFVSVVVDPSMGPPPSPSPRRTPTPPPLPVATSSVLPSLAPPSWQDLISVAPTTKRFSMPPAPVAASPHERRARLLCGMGGLAQLLVVAIPTRDWVPWAVVMSHLLLLVPVYFLAKALNRNVAAWMLATFIVPLAPVLLAFAPRRTS